MRINVYTREGWRWMHYPVTCSHYTVERLKEMDWRKLCPTLVLRAHAAELHIPQVKKIEARKVVERKQDPDLVTVAVDLNVKNLAVVTVEVNHWGTSQHCSRCGAKGERFSASGRGTGKVEGRQAVLVPTVSLSGQRRP